MSKFVSVLANEEIKDSLVVTVTEAFAKSIDATVLEDEPAVDHLGKPLQPRVKGAYLNPPEPNFAPAIALPDDEDVDESGSTGATGSRGPAGATGAPNQTTGATTAPANPPTGGSAASQPEEATK